MVFEVHLYKFKSIIFVVPMLAVVYSVFLLSYICTYVCTCLTQVRMYVCTYMS